MAVPKRRTSQSKRRKRRSHQAIERPQVTYCGNCGGATLPHCVCPHCDHYNGRFYTPEEVS